MKTASATYKILQALDTSWYEWRILQGENVYGLDKLLNIAVHFTITSGSGIDIGNANPAQCQMTLMEESANWQRMAMFTVQFRICSAGGGTKSEWLTLGKFYTDVRSEDQYGNLTIIGYDAILKLEQTWTDKIPEQLLPSSFPITAKAWATLIQSSNLANFADLTQLDDTVAFVGLNTTSTIRDVLKSIAAVHAGNWIMTTSETLNLMQYEIFTGKNLWNESYPNITTTSSSTVIYFPISVGDGEFTLSTDMPLNTRESANLFLLAGNVSSGASTSSNGVYIDHSKTVTSSGGYVTIGYRYYNGVSPVNYHTQLEFGTSATSYEPYSGRNRIVDLGQAVTTLDTSPSLQPVTGVHLETEIGTVMESGDASGYMVKGMCDVSSTTGVSELCLSKIEGYVFKPFEADTAYLDPRADVGDSVKIDGAIYQIMSIDWTLGKTPTANISAPFDQEIDHEYTIPNQDTKTYRKAMSLVDEKMDDYVPWDEFATAIEQNEQAVVIAASHTYVTQNEYNAQIAEIQSQLDGSIQSWSGNAVPTLNNAPAEDWTTPTQRAEHVGDTYFVNSDAGIPEAGNYYRFEVNNGVYSWQLLNDSVLTEALAKAAAALAAAEDAQDTASESLTEAQSKGRIFVVQPTPPYDVGDLWFNDTNSVIKVCMTARESGNYIASDWVKRDKYIDEIDLETYLADSELIQSLQNQLDQKAETYYQSADPAIEWGIHPVGIAIAGLDTVGISGVLAAQHTGDLWYRTTDNTTWYFNGNTWERQDVPADVFDKIDGKAQVFINEPYAPYYVGDLWFNSDTEDIKTCIRERTTFGFVETDWAKRNKYTDDTAVDALREEVTAEFEVQSDAISAKVSRTGGSNSSFGWVLNDTSHTWYSDNQVVMSISHQNGLVVKGNITATSGFIGNSSSGFEITATAIRNGMTALNDTVHNGIYVGTDGVALGKGNFKVTSNGDITAKSGTIGGFTITATSLYNGMTSFSDTTHNGVYIGTDGIALGQGKFRVTPNGDLYADDGYFLGLVQAQSIMSKVDDPVFGTFNGGGLTEYSVSGGVGGQIGYANNGGIIGANLEYSTVETAQVSPGINTSLGYANFADGVFNARNTAGYVKTNAIIDGSGRTFYSDLLAYKNHQGTNMYARVWISTTDY